MKLLLLLLPLLVFSQETEKKLNESDALKMQILQLKATVLKERFDSAQLLYNTQIEPISQELETLRKKIHAEAKVPENEWIIDPWKGVFVKRDKPVKSVAMQKLELEKAAAEKAKTEKQ